MSKIIGILNTLTPLFKSIILVTLAAALLFYKDVVFIAAGFLVLEAIYELPKIHDKITALETRIKTETK